MDIHYLNLKVTQDDLDELNHVNNVRFVYWVNKIAVSHWKSLATPEILNNFFWVLITHKIDYKNQILLNETVTLKSYIKEGQGVTCLRVVEILVGDKLCAYSETKWCFIKAETKKPARITPEVQSLFL